MAKHIVPKTWDRSSTPTGPWSSVPSAVPSNTGAPAITGTNTVGYTLTASHGSWSGSPTSYAYQWYRCATLGGTYSAISSETASTYLLDAADEDYYIKVGVVATNGSGNSSEVRSSATSAIGTQTLIGASDFTYLGKYELNHSAVGDGYSSALFARSVSGVQRIGLIYSPGSTPSVYEFSLAGVSFGDTLYDTDIINSWGMAGVMGTGDGRHWSATWLPSLDRLCITQSVDYPAGGEPPGGYPTSLHFVTLTDGGSTVGTPKKISLEGVIDRLCSTGILEVPSSFQASIGGKPFMTGFGAYHSRMSSFATSLGLSCHAIPDPSGYFGSAPANPVDHEDEGAVIPATSIKTLSQHSHTNRGVRGYYGYTFTQTGTNDDYSLYSPNNLGMGATGIPSGTFEASHPTGAIGPINYFDGGDPRTNPGSIANPVGPPDFEPFAGASPYYNYNGGIQTSVDHWGTGDDVCFWPWGDKYVKSFMVDGARRGLVAILGGSCGNVYYYSSAGTSDILQGIAEAHVFDPDDLAAVYAGTKDAADIQPIAIIPLTDTLDDTDSLNSYAKFMASYEPVSKRLYIAINRGQTAPGASNVRNWYVHVYQVNS